MQLIHLTTLIALAVSAITVSASPSADIKEKSSISMTKRRWQCPNGQRHGSNNGGQCVPINPELPVCVAGLINFVGKPTYCAQAQYSVVGPSTKVTVSENTKSWNILSTDYDRLPTVEFKGSIGIDDTLEFSAMAPDWHRRLNVDQRITVALTDVFFEYRVGDYTFYYKVRGNTACKTPGPQDYNLFELLSEIRVLKQ